MYEESQKDEIIARASNPTIVDPASNVRHCRSLAASDIPVGVSENSMAARVSKFIYFYFYKLSMRKKP